jgi:hypothetical protein
VRRCIGCDQPFQPALPLGHTTTWSLCGAHGTVRVPTPAMSLVARYHHHAAAADRRTAVERAAPRTAGRVTWSAATTTLTEFDGVGHPGDLAEHSRNEP